MSTFLGFFSFLMDSSSTVASVKDMLSSNLTTCGWQVLRQAVNPNSIFGTLATPANAFDQNSITQAGGAGVGTLGCVAPSAFTPTAMYIQVNNDAGASAPLAFDLQYSTTSGASWLTLQTWTSQTNWTNCERRKYVVSGATAQTYWRLNVTSSNGVNTYITEWTLEDATGHWLTNTTFLDVMPPTYEFIGNSTARDILRFYVGSNSIDLLPVSELLSPLPQFYSFDTSTAGAVTLSVHISNTVSYTGTSGNTAAQNARGLYEALKNSSYSDFLQWKWVWVSTQSGAGYFQAVQNTPASNVTITSTNISTSLRGSYASPMVQGSQLSPINSVTIDLNFGFIYYLQVCSRGIALATRTNSAYITPVHACYGDNISAVAQTPISDIPGIPCTPIDLIVGTDEATSQTGASGYASHWWGVAGSGSNGLQQIDTSNNSSSIWSRHQVPGQIQDYSATAFGAVAGGVASVNMSLTGEGMFTGADSGVLYSVHRMSCNPANQFVSVLDYSSKARIVGPNYANLDWYKFSGSLADEQVIFSPCTDYTTAITTAGASTDTTIHVVNAIGFPTTGFIFIDGEIISYSGITPTSFTGCTRGLYNTPAQGLFSGTTVFIGGWFVKIQNGLLFAGYQLPT
jgi:hypothetical protein